MSDIRLLEIPKWGLSMEEGTVIGWLISEGDDFSEGQEICEIESSKIANVLEAPYSGTLRKIIAVPGDTLPVQAPIAVSASKDVPDSVVESFVAGLGGAVESKAASSAESDNREVPRAEAAQDLPGRSRPSSLQTIAVSTAIAIPLSLQSGTDDSGAHATPRARSLAARHGINLTLVEGTGRNQRISVADLRNAVSQSGGSLPAPPQFVTAGIAHARSSADDSGIPATPLARRVAASYGLNLNDCKPSGRTGRVLRADVEAAQLRLDGPAVADRQPGTPGIEPLPESPHRYIDAPLSGMRKTIAARLAQSKQSAPHYRMTVDCRISSLLALRKQINAENPAAKVSVNDFLVKAAAMALIEVPECNIQFNGEVIRTFDDAHISVAVALESGLITPIIHMANKKGLVEISNETKSLVTRAKARTLKAENFEGGTFTVSNLGMFGVRHFDAIINPPQAAILAVGAGDERVLAVAGEQVVATAVTVTLSSDHRVIDGATGARWLSAFRDFAEQPARLLS